MFEVGNIISIAVFVFTILFGIIGFFLKRVVKDVDFLKEKAVLKDECKENMEGCLAGRAVNELKGEVIELKNEIKENTKITANIQMTLIKYFEKMGVDVDLHSLTKK